MGSFKKKFFVVMAILLPILLLTGLVRIIPIENAVSAAIFAISILLTAQGLFALFLMIYAWENPEQIKKSRSPKQLSDPKFSFTILLPARHEEKVIGQTIKSLSSINYPDELVEILIPINRIDDEKTIEVAEAAIEKTGKGNIKLVTFEGYPINKPHGLNIALKQASKDVITIFDAEDEPHKDILNIINTVMIRDSVDVVQSGVQIMNYKTNWYSLFNVLEYFFWFKSALHFFAASKIVPLGGNTVFFKRSWVENVGGWDPTCLTEDADIGIRLSVAGAKTCVVYDEEHATHEETPPTLGSFIRQRTRWNQGFIQILAKGDWLKLPSFKQKVLALYILSWPIIQAFLFINFPIALLVYSQLKLPPLLGIISNFPTYIIFSFIILLIMGMYEFTRDYGKKFCWWIPFKLIIFFFPFIIVLSFSSFRALVRHISNNLSWEKTEHVNRYRAVN